MRQNLLLPLKNWQIITPKKVVAISALEKSFTVTIPLCFRSIIDLLSQ